jgi:hypothetical protein
VIGQAVSNRCSGQQVGQACSISSWPAGDWLDRTSQELIGHACLTCWQQHWLAPACLFNYLPTMFDLWLMLEGLWNWNCIAHSLGELLPFFCQKQESNLINCFNIFKER